MLLVMFSACASGVQQAQVDVFRIPDQPVQATNTSEWAELERVMAPYVAQARASYHEVRIRYLAGLPPGQSLYVVARLRDAAHRVEQAFISVEMIQNGFVTGRIASDIQTVRGYANGDWYALPETDIVDWVILHSDGSEEGNVVGKFLDEYHKPDKATQR